MMVAVKPPKQEDEPSAFEAFGAAGSDAFEAGSDAFARGLKQLRKLPQGSELDPIQAVVVSGLVSLPFVGFLSYPLLATAVRDFIDSRNTFQAVDGNAFAAELLRPTVNGVLVPCCAIILGTLLATTVNVLRNRQVEMRSCISKEACELRLLRRAIFGMFGTAQHARRRKLALAHMREYTVQCVKETRAFAFDELALVEERGGSVSVNQLEEISAMLHGIDGAAACRDFSVGSAQATLQSLNGLRSDRLASLLSGFPVVHWLILGLLSSSLVLLFLIDSNQDVLQYLNSLQLRLLFAILLTTFCATAGLCLDLADPFRGSTTINTAGAQFRYLKQGSLAEAQKQRTRGLAACCMCMRPLPLVPPCSRRPLRLPLPALPPACAAACMRCRLQLL